MQRRLTKIAFVILSLILAVSCAPTENAAYVSNFGEFEFDDKADQKYLLDNLADNLIRPGDELYISVTSSDEGPTNFNRTEGQRVYDVDLISHYVDNDGFIKLPYIEKVKVSELTLKEAEILIEEELSQFLYFPAVNIKFVNNRVTVLGEVRDPGVYFYNYKNINIYQAIGYASDITEFGNRKNVLLVRKDDNEISKKYLDLTQDEILTSEWFFVKSNDIIYVEPLNRKKWGIQTFPYDLLISAISTTLVILSFLNSNGNGI